jgi:small subunit ribosomal protein S6e
MLNYILNSERPAIWASLRRGENVFKIVVSDPKTKRTYQKEVGYKESGLLGRKLGDRVKGEFLGLHGFELQLTGGSDKQGFPMRQDIQGSVRKKILLTGQPGFHPTTKGERRRKPIRGNTLSEEIVQVNMKVVTYGKDTLAKLFGKEEPKEAKHEEKAEHKKEEKKEAHNEAHAEKKHEEHKEAAHEKPAEHKEHKPEHAEHKAEHSGEHKPEHAEHKAEKKD